MSVLGNDTFTRTNVASGFGTATDGQTWVQIVPTGFATGTTSVTSNEGVIVNNGVDTIFSLGPASADGEVLARFSINNSGDTLGLQLRTQNVSGSVSNYKFLWYAGNVHLNKDVGNSNTQNTTVAFSVTTNTFYWMRFRLVGSVSWGKIWAAGSAEPAAWTTTFTDTSVTGVGTASLLGNTGSGSSGVRFDSFYAVDYPLQDSLTPSDSFSSSITYAPTDSVTSTETNAETIAESITDTALSCSDTIIAANPPLTVSGTDSVTTVDSLSDTLASSITDVVLTTADSLVATLTVTYALSDIVITTSDSIAGAGSTLNIAYNAGWTVLGNDTGTRANSSGTWGTSTDGQTWSIPTGSATLAVSSDELTATACTTATYIKLGSNTSADAEVLVRTSVNNTSSNGNGVFLRMTGSTTAYRCRLNASTSSIGFGFAKLVANTSTNLTTITFTESTSTFYWIRFRVQGTNLLGKVWATGTAEPAAWSVTTTDSSITGAGGFGIYDSGSATGNIASYDNFYCVDNVLADNSIPPPADAISDSVIFVPTESQTIVESPNEVEVYATSDVALSIVETAAYVETFIGAEQKIPNLDFYIPGDTLTYANTAVGIIQVDALTCSDAVVFTQVFIPIEGLNNTETLNTTLATNVFFSWQEANTCAETILSTVANLVTDSISCTENVTFLGVLSLLDSGTSVGDSVADAISYVPVDSISCTETIVETLAFSWLDDAPTVSDSLFSTRPVVFIDDTLNTTDSTSTILVQSDVWQGSLSEFKVYAETFVPTDALTQLETPTYTEIFSITDVALTISDTLLSGVPSNFISDALTITESLVVIGSVPALLFTDQLLPSDNLFVLDNFTDSNFVIESYITTIASNTLEPRSNLYTTIIADAPTVYYQMDEGQFNGIFQRDGQDNVNNASNPTIIGALLSYTWAQLEPTEGVYNWSLIDNDILPWSNQSKSIVLRVYTAATLADNAITHFNMTATQATPSWVFTAGAPSVTGFDSVVYPVYWDLIYQAKYAAFIKQFALRYDTNPYVRGIVIGAGVDGSTTLEKSGDTTGNTLALWGPRGYSSATWAAAIHWATATYANSFARTGILLSINSAFVVPDAVYNITYCLDVAVQHAIWALDENASINNLHTGQQWDIVTLATIAPGPTSVTGSTLAIDLAVAINEGSDYTAVWASDVTAPTNQPILTTYAAKATERFLHDIAPLQKNVTVSGAVYPSSRIITGDYLNGAQQFDGFTGYGMMTQAFQGDHAKWTMKASIYPTVLPTQEAIIIANGQTGVAAYGGYALGIASGSAGGAGQNLCAFIPGYGWYDSGYTLPAVNTWYCCFMVYDGTNLTFYVNGMQTPLSPVIATYAMQPRATIGMIWDAVTLKELRYFTGYIDEIALYPTNLTSTRIAAISAAEMGLTDVNSSSTSFFTVQDGALTVSDSSSTITVTQSITDSLTINDTFAQSSINVAFLGETILVDDFFNRSNQVGLGVATDGQIWTQPTNNGTLSIVGNQGQITGMNGANVMFLGSNTAALVDGRIHITMQVGTDATVGIILRATDATHYYVARLNATNFGIVKVSGGSTTNIDDVAFTPSGGAGYWIRFRAVGSLLMAKYWIDTTSEPNSYSSIGTDATYATGQMGLYASTTTGTDIYTFSNFFAVDNYMTDFIPVSELYNTTEILPPFTDTVNETEVTLVVESEINLDVSVTEVEAVVYNTIMLNTDGLSLGTSVQSWSVSFIPTETLTVIESLLSNSPTPLASDILVLTDASTVTNNPAPVDILSIGDETIVEAIAFVPVETVTVQEVGLEIEFDYPNFDLVFINEFPVYTDTNLVADSVTTTDTIGFTQIFVPVDNMVSVDASTTTSIFALVDVAPTTSDLVNNTEVFMNTDVATGDGTLDDFSSMFAIALSLVDVAPTTSDSILGSNVLMISDVALTPSDIIGTVNNPSPVDITNTSDALACLLAESLFDTMTTSEILLSSSPANIFDVTLASSDIITPTGIEILIDVSSGFDLYTSSILLSLQEAVTSTDVITPTDIPLLVDSVSTTDSVTDSIVLALTDNNNQTTDYLFTPVMSNNAEPTITAQDLTLALVLTSNLVDTPTLQDTLVPTNIFILNDIALTVGAETLIMSLFSVAPADTSFELESLILTDIPLGLTDAISPSDIFMSVTNTTQTDIITTTEINSVQFAVQFAESFNETEVNIFALVTSLTADQINENETLLSTLYENDVTTLTIADISTLTGIDLNTDFVSSTSDIVFDGDIFVPIDPMNVAEMLLAAEIYAAADAVNNTEAELITNIVVPIDALIAQDTSIAETSFEILSDVLTAVDVSAMQDVYVPIDVVTANDGLSLALSAALLEALTLVDVSTTTIENRSIDVTPLAVSVQNWIVKYVPVEAPVVLDVSTLTLTQFELDTLTAQDIAASVGYGLLDVSLSISEALNFSAKVYVTVQGTIFSGIVNGQISNGIVNGQVFSGEIQGVLP